MIRDYGINNIKYNSVVFERFERLSTHYSKIYNRKLNFEPSFEYNASTTTMPVQYTLITFKRISKYLFFWEAPITQKLIL